jgi:hypothetical protein
MSPTEPQQSPMPRLYIPPDTPRYRYLRLLWEGVPLAQAAGALKLKHSRARQWRGRLRQEAGALLGRRVNDTVALRLLFAPETVQKTLDLAQRDTTFASSA